MGIRLQRQPDGVPDDGNELSDANGSDDITPHETHYDGMTFSWGPGQVRNFLDEGVALGHQANLANASVVKETGLYATNGESRF